PLGERNPHARKRVRARPPDRAAPGLRFARREVGAEQIATGHLAPRSVVGSPENAPPLELLRRRDDYQLGWAWYDGRTHVHSFFARHGSHRPKSSRTSRSAAFS